MASLAWGALGGALSTVAMDVGSTAARKTGVVAGVQPRWTGRWFQGWARRQLRHQDIRASQSHRGELPTALVSHYLIGSGLGAAWSLLARRTRRGAPRFFGGVLFGLATNVLPLLFMYPAMGFGFFGRRGPAELKLPRTAVINHLLFGLGLGVTSELLPI